MSNAKKFSLDDASSYKDGNSPDPSAAPSRPDHRVSPQSPSEGFGRHVLMEDSAPLHASPNPPLSSPGSFPTPSADSPSSGHFGETKSEPSWLRKTLGHGFKLFKEDSKAHTMASISLEDINSSKVEAPSRQNAYKPRPDASLGRQPGANFNSQPEFTNFSHASKAFLKEEEQRRSLQAKLRAKNATNMGGLGQSSGLPGSTAPKIFMLILLLGGGLLVGRFAWKWMHGSGNKTARSMRGKLGEVVNKPASKRAHEEADHDAAGGMEASGLDKEDMGQPDLVPQNIKPRRLK